MSEHTPGPWGSPVVISVSPAELREVGWLDRGGAPRSECDADEVGDVEDEGGND